jgi:hypothetical protein
MCLLLSYFNYYNTTNASRILKTNQDGYIDTPYYTNTFDNSVSFATDKKKERFDVIIVKNINGKYHLIDYGYSTIYVWQNRILNFLSFMIVAIISYLYFKFVNKK